MEAGWAFATSVPLSLHWRPALDDVQNFWASIAYEDQDATMPIHTMLLLWVASTPASPLTP